MADINVRNKRGMGTVEIKSIYCYAYYLSSRIRLLILYI